MAKTVGMNRTQSQTVKAQLRLRELILAGELAPGVRISEPWVVDRIGVSRTPIREALIRLQEEGLLEAIPSGGYTARSFTETDISDAIEVRGTMEGLAARLAAERGASRVQLDELKHCLARIDAVLAGANDQAEDHFNSYVEWNDRFHSLLKQLSGSAVIARQVDRATSLPFASPNGFLLTQATDPVALQSLLIAQDQHHQVVEAIEMCQGERAEAIMREHARLAHRNLRSALRDQNLKGMPGSKLIQRIA